jgi:hypothetical protein
MRENILVITNHLLSSTWIFVLLGIGHMIIIENKSILAFAKQKKIKLLVPLLKRGSYLIMGLILIFLSFAIVNTILSALVPESMQEIDYGEAKDFWTTWKYQTQYAGLFSVIGFIIAGISLILSAGGKWLVNLTKLFVSLTVLYLFFSVLIGYA